MSRFRIKVGLLVIMSMLITQTLCVNISSVASDKLVSICEEYCYQTLFNSEKRLYVQNQSSHRISVSGHGLVDSGHNFTLAMEIDESLLSSVPLEARSLKVDGTEYATILFNGTDFDNVFFLENTLPHPCALNVTTTPSDLDLLSADESRYLDVDLLLQSSEFIDSVYMEVGSSYSKDILDYVIHSDLSLSYQYFYNGVVNANFQNVTVGSHEVLISMKMSDLEGDFPIRLDCHRSSNLALPINVFLDGEEIEANHAMRYLIDYPSIGYLCAKVPWIYGYSNPQTYNVTFLSGKNLRLRVDPLSRERIEFLLAQRGISNFTVDECMVENCRAFLFSINLNDSSMISLGITLYDKRWFLRPSVMKLSDIPGNILDEYVHPRPEEYIDSDNDYVRLWSSQVVGNETNPLLIASLIYANLTKTLNYTESFAAFCLANETASAALRYRAGVCRHFSRAFAALATVSGLPVRLVTGTALNLDLPATTLKKNHSWCEVFFPRFGWVPVDVTWKKFGVLPNTHAIVTFWEYEKGILNISVVNGSQIYRCRRDSAFFLGQLVQACENMISNYDLSNGEELSLLLDEANVLADNGMSHETLLVLEHIYELSRLSLSENPHWVEIILIILIITLLVVVFTVCKRWSSSRKHKSKPPDSLERAFDCPSCFEKLGFMTASVLLLFPSRS